MSIASTSSDLQQQRPTSTSHALRTLERSPAFDSLSDEGLEAPTVPSSPLPGPCISYYAPPKPSGHFKFSINTSADLDEDTIQAGQSRCAICKKRISKTSMRATLAHINACWDQLRVNVSKTQNLKAKSTTSVALPATNTSSLNVGGKTPDKSAQTIVAQPTAELVRSLPPTIAPRATNPPNLSTACIICNKSFDNWFCMDTVIHMRHCLQQFFPFECPVCRSRFSPDASTPWTPDTVLEHLDYCEHRDFVSRAEHRVTFAQTLSLCDDSWDVTPRRLSRAWGPKKAWRSRDHLRSFKAKFAVRHLGTDRKFTMEHSPLRMVMNAADMGNNGVY